jgi:restriction endonuclease fold toxin 2 of polymorphic toxin system
LFNASAQFQDHRLWANDILQTLGYRLAGSRSMAGADPVGNSFGHKYDSSAGSVADGLSRAAQGLGQVGLGLLSMVSNYIAADAAAVVFRSNIPLPRQLQEECQQVRVALPSAVGENQVNVVTVLAPYWPQGDPVRLRQAAHAWQEAAVAIKALTDAANASAIAAYASGSGRALDDFEAYWANFHGSRGLLDLLSASCSSISRACSWMAQHIEDLQHQLEVIAEVAGAVAVLAIGLTIFTVGLSDAGGVVLEGGLAADAAAAVGAAEVAEATAAETTALVAVAAEVDGVAASLPEVAAVAVNLTPVAVSLAVLGPAFVSVFEPLEAAAAGYSPSVGVPGVGPVPPDPSPAFPLLSPQDQAAATTWMLSLQPSGIRGSSPGDPEYQYQLRVAGPTEYHMQGGSAQAVWADGFRPADGAIIEAKYVGDSNKTCFTPNNENDRPQFLYDKILAQQSDEISRYGSVIQDPANHARFLEIETNDPIAALYFQVQLGLQHVNGKVRLIP